MIDRRIQMKDREKGLSVRDAGRERVKTTRARKREEEEKETGRY